MSKYWDMMDLLSSADLAEATNENWLARSYEYYKKRLLRENKEKPTIKEIWLNVYKFYHNPVNGIFPRLDAISCPEIRVKVDKTLEWTKYKMNTIKEQYGFSYLDTFCNWQKI